MTPEDLIKSDGYWVAKIQSDLYRVITEYMDNNNIGRKAVTKLCKKTNIPCLTVVKILNGDYNGKVEEFIDICLKLGVAPIIKFENINKIKI